MNSKNLLDNFFIKGSSLDLSSDAEAMLTDGLCSSPEPPEPQLLRSLLELFWRSLSGGGTAPPPSAAAADITRLFCLYI